MKIILNSGKTISVSKKEAELIQEFLMNKGWEDRHIRLKTHTWYFAEKIMVIKANDISAVL